MNSSPTDLFIYPDLPDTSSVIVSSVPPSIAPPITPEQEQAVLDSAIELGEVSTINLTKDIFAVVEQGDNSSPNTTPTPKTTSLQPLAEALKLTGGVSPQHQEVAAKARVIEAGIRDVKKRVELQSDLTEKKEQALPDSLTQGISKAECATQAALDASTLYLQRQGNLTISSNNGIRLSSLEGVNISGSSTFIGTGTTVFNNQLTSITSEAIVNISDTTISRVNGSQFTHIEDSNQISARNAITRASETNQVITTRSFTHAAELNSMTGETMQSTAGSGGHTVHATGGINNFTEAGMVNLAREQITIGAGSPAPPSTPPPKGMNELEFLNRFEGNHSCFTRFTANGESPGITTVTSGSNSSVSQGPSMSMSSNSYISASQSAVQVAGTQVMNGVTGPAGDTRSHVYQQGKLIINGRMVHGFPAIDMSSIVFPTAPALPPKPNGYTTADLKKCIPPNKVFNKNKKIDRKGDQDSATGDIRGRAARVLGIDPEQIQEQAGANVDRKGEAQVTPGVSATPQDLSSNSTITQMPPSTESSTIEEMPPPTPSTGIQSMAIAVGAVGGPPGIYIDRYKNSSEPISASSSSDMQELEAVTEESLLESMHVGTHLQKLIYSLTNECSSLSIEPSLCNVYIANQEFFNSTITRASLSFLYPSEGIDLPVEELIDKVRLNLEESKPELMSNLYQRGGLDLLRLFIEANKKDFSEASRAMAMGPGPLDDIRRIGQDALGYTQLAEEAQGVARSMGIDISIPGVGHIGSIVSRGLGIAESVQSAIDQQSGPLDLGSVLSIGSNAIEAIGVDLPANVSSLINNAGSIEDYLRANPDPELLDFIRDSSITNALSDVFSIAGTDNPIEELLGPNYLDAIEPIESLIRQIDSSSPIDREAFKEDLSKALSSLGLSDISSKIDSVYNRVNPLLTAIEEGRLVDLRDPRTAAAIDTFLGNNIASQLLEGYQKVQSIIDNVETLTAIPELLEMMDKQDVPLLSRMSLMLSCLDVFNRLKQIASAGEGLLDTANSVGGSIDDLFSNKEDDTPNLKEAKERIRKKRSLASSTPATTRSYIAPLERNLEEDLKIRSSLLILIQEGLIKEDEPLYIETTNPYQPLTGYIRKEEVLSIKAPSDSSLPSSPSINLIRIAKPDNSYVSLYPYELRTISNASNNLLWTNEISDISANPLNPYISKPISILLDNPKVYVDSSFNSKAAQVFENLPYLVQYIRYIDSLPTSYIESLPKLGVSQDIADSLLLIKTSKPLPTSTSLCYDLPQLDIYQSAVSILEVSTGLIRFKAKDIKKPSLMPGIGNLLHICIKTFVRSGTGRYLRVFQDDREYSPCVFRYKVIAYRADTKEGIARVEGPEPFITLEDLTGVLYQYPIGDIGGKIIPNIERANLLI
jgi:hypothetical protein